MKAKVDFLVLSLLSLLAFGTVSCSNNDLYDPNYIAEHYADQWAEKFGSVDNAQDWMMAKKITATLTSDEDGTFYLYNGDPTNTGSNALLLAQCDAKKGQAVTISFDAPETLNTVFVGIYKDGFLRVKPVAVESESIVIDLNQASSRSVLSDAAKVAFDNIWNPDPSVPSDATSYAEGISRKGNSYYITGTDVTLSEIPAGATELFVSKSSTLTVSSSLSVTDLKIYNQGIVTVNGELALSGSSVLRNEGGKLIVQNFTQSSGVYVLNNLGVVTVSETTKACDVSKNPFICYNNGHWNTKNLEYTASNQPLSGGSEWVNICTLKVSGTFKMSCPDNEYNNLCVFIADDGTLTEINDAYFSHSIVTLYGSAYVKITGTAVFGPTEYDPDSDLDKEEGIRNIGDASALLQIHKAVLSDDSDARAVFLGNSDSGTGKLYVACSDFFSDLSSADYSSKVLLEDAVNSYKTGENNAPITIETTDCCPATYENNRIDPLTTPQSFIMACEDLGSTGDYDFNDIVFSVAHAEGSTEATVTPLAAGGTLAATILYDGTEIGEIHSLLGSSSTATMINTQSITAAGTAKTITVPADWMLSANYSKFSVKVENGTASQFVTAPSNGDAPQMIIVPGDWQWPLERVSIEAAYPRFTDWVSDATSNDWIDSRNDGKTVTR